jgi:hypothetical protein
MEETSIDYCGAIILKSALRNLKSAIILCAVLIALCSAAAAQQPTKVPRIGFLVPGSSVGYSVRIEAFLQGARAWIRGGRKHCH